MKILSNYKNCFNSQIIFSYMETVLRAVMGQNNTIILKEHVASFFPKLVEEYCRARSPVILNEIEYVNGVLENKFQKIVMVGGGPIPFSAIYLAKLHEGPIYVLEKSRLAKIVSTRLIHRLGMKNVKILCGTGEHYDSYKDCVVIISLYAENKNMILKKIFENNQRNNLILLRSFIDEEYGSLGKEFKVIKHGSKVQTLVL